MGLPTPLRDGLARHADMLIVRELSGGVYFGEPRGSSSTDAFNTWRQSADQGRAVAHVAFREAPRRRQRLTSVNNATAPETSPLCRPLPTQPAPQHPALA